MHITLHVALQVLIILQEGLAEVEIDRVSRIDVFEVVPLLQNLLRVPTPYRNTILPRTRGKDGIPCLNSP